MINIDLIKKKILKCWRLHKIKPKKSISITDFKFFHFDFYVMCTSLCTRNLFNMF